MNIVASILERSLRKLIVFVERHPWFTAFLVLLFVGVRVLFGFFKGNDIAEKLGRVLAEIYVRMSDFLGKIPRPARIAVDVLLFVVAPVPFLIWWLLMDAGREAYIAQGDSDFSAEASSRDTSPGGSLPNETEPGPFEPGGEFDPFTYKF